MAERKSLGRVRGGMTYAGSGITGSSTTATVFPGSGVTKAYPEDVYINTDTDDSCGNVYSCVTGGDANTATWVYNGNIRGPQPPVENSLTSSSQTNALSAAMGKKLNEKIVDSGAFPLTFIPSCDQTTYVASITMENVDSEITIKDVNGNVGTYTVTKSGTSDDRTETIPIDSSIGLASTGAVIASIESSDGVFKSVKFYNSMSTEIYSEEFKIWDHVIAVEENITPGTSISETYTEGGTQQTTYYKTGAISKLINGIRSALFPVTHAKAVWFNKHENTTVYDEIEDINSELISIENIADCATGRDTAAKVVTLPGFVLKQNARIVVRFTDTGATNPISGNLTLNVNGTGAKTIIDGHNNNATMTYANAGYFYNNQVCEFVYNGTAWVWLNRDTNTTYTGDNLKTKTAKTGSGSTVTGTIAANTKVDDAIGTLLNNDYALNQNLTEKVAQHSDATYQIVKGLGYDAINKKLGLVIEEGGADSVIPFDSSKPMPYISAGNYNSGGSGGGTIQYLSTDGTYKSMTWNGSADITSHDIALFTGTLVRVNLDRLRCTLAEGGKYILTKSYTGGISTIVDLAAGTEIIFALSASATNVSGINNASSILRIE